MILVVCVSASQSPSGRPRFGKTMDDRPAGAGDVFVVRSADLYGVQNASAMVAARPLARCRRVNGRSERGRRRSSSRRRNER